MKQRALFFSVLLTFFFPSISLTQQAVPQSSLSISFPHETWALELDSPGFTVESEGPKPDGREYLLATNSETGMVLSVTLEKSSGGADSKTCPNYLKKRMQSMAAFDPKDVKTSEIGGMAAVEYMVLGPRENQVQQKNFVACTAKDDVYVDIHLSKVKFQPSDEQSFIDVLKHVQFVNAATPAVSATVPPSTSQTASMDLFREGSKRFQSQDFSGAIGPYQQALDIEKKQPHLSKTLWYVLVDNLGMAYGISGDLDHAEETFNYGVSQDSSYPMFYYNLACTYAGRNNKEKTVDYLRMAFARKGNVIPGESMPDPRKDDSFQEFMKDEQFRELADSLYSSN